MTPHPEQPTAARAGLYDRSTLHDYADVAAAAGVRSVRTHVEELRDATGRPIRRAAATAVIRNPWIGTGTEHDLADATERVAPLLAKLLTDRLLARLGGASEVIAFGKAAIVGIDGEIEHAGALIHTPYFGNLVREALGGTSILCFADGRATPGALLRVPMWHKTAAATRDYYQTLEVPLGDAPHAGEIAVVAAASTGPRPFARIGDRATDRPITSEILKEIAL
ncbi:amino acid synthesis family protein [Gulosibacter sp. 10]|uniref:amino acid synthesis family protein n=1 Tax=Gulosibacter sp. 10 TaxID=1255570 RepID=UPI00097E8510|nr:amino acid synthesis family protein [Gulosibacter sp. 10]SJM51009.1 hypothetical protein FM112_01720 [Gulosibacter sp. 10]